MSFDVYAMVTDKIISELEKGKIPWIKPWNGVDTFAVSGSTGKRYSLLNQILLSLSGFSGGEWYTFKQVSELGGKVKKGEKGSTVVYWNMIRKEDKEHLDENGEPKIKMIPVLKYYTVFNILQCEGIEAKYTKEYIPNEFGSDDIADKAIADYVSRENIKLIHDVGDKACYTPSIDRVTLPEKGQFKCLAEYYSTAFHELVHSTGHKDRLNRIKATAHFGSEDYSAEELCAEIGASFLMNDFEIETDESFKNSAAYIQSWLKALKNDKKMIVTASGKAEKAIDYFYNGKKVS